MKNMSKMISIAFISILTVGLLFLFLSFRVYKYSSSGMMPHIKPGQRIIVNKSAYVIGSPDRGDIVVFVDDDTGVKLKVMRIAGLPEEKFEIKDGRIFINDKIVDFPEVFKKLVFYNRGDYAQEGKTVTIPKDQYYLLGDNNLNSLDSRYFGFIPRIKIIGKVVMVGSKGE